MSKDQYNESDSKVLPIEPYLKAKEEEEEGISLLLNHMRQVREAVPVNRQLQVELRKKLLERKSQLMSQGAERFQKATPVATTSHPTANNRSAWLTKILGVVAVIAIAVGLTSYWHYANGTNHLEAIGSPQELNRFWTETIPLQPAVSPDGSKIIVVRTEGLVLLSSNGSQLANLNASEGMSFRSPSWSPDGKEISFVVTKGETEEIKQLTEGELFSPANSRYIAVEPKVKQQSLTNEGPVHLTKKREITHFTNLNYSPDGQNLAYVASTAGGTSQIWVRKSDSTEKQITEGEAPTWSPDSKHIVVQRPSRNESYELWLIDIETGKANLLGPGEKPTWAKNGYLAFSTEKTEERILTFLPNGEPQYTVRQQVPEIRTLYLGKDGSQVLKRIKDGESWLTLSHLLIVPENRISGIEMNWLRQQELIRANTPKTLVLNEILQSEGQVFGPDGNWLLFARRDGDTVALLKVRLEERWEKERD